MIAYPPKHFVTYLIPGSFFSESTTEKIDSWDVNAAKNMAPSNAFAFSFQTKVIEGEGWNQEIKTIQSSGTYYLGGEIFSQSDIQRLDKGDLDILLSNMRGNNWDHVIRTKFGNYQPFTSKDQKV